jgi:hypothetical protein
MIGMLSKFELDYLGGKIQLDEKATSNVRYRLKKNLKELAYLELPLIIDYEQRSAGTPLMKKNESVIIFLSLAVVVVVAAVVIVVSSFCFIPIYRRT